MKPAPFSYHAPRTVAELVELAAQYGQSSCILAGGQSLVPLLNMRRVHADHLIDLNGVHELDRIDADEGSIVIGALVRQARALADPTVARMAPLVVEALAHVASPTVRNRGTVCGNLVFAQPGSELQAVALATGGTATALSERGARAIAFDEFFVGPYQTALHSDEVVIEVRLHSWGFGAGHSFLEVSRLRLPVVCVAVLTELDSGLVSRCAISLSGVLGTPVRSTRAEARLVGEKPTDDAIADAAWHATDGLEAMSSIHGSREYRLHVARTLVRRGVRIAVARAERSRA